jgi:hypothetical protein
LSAIGLISAYRAATQSLTHDEALTWQLYLAGPPATIFEHYDANHHFLATLLFRLSASLFGHAEWAIRLPTVLAGWWFLWTLRRLTLLSFGPGPLAAIAAITVAGNPFLGDFLVAARGYGLALACFCWALYCLVRYGGCGDRKLLFQAGAAGSLSVAANLVFVLPWTCLLIAFLACLPRRPAEAAPTRKKKRQTATASGRQVAAAWPPLTAGAGLVLVLFLLSAPLHRAERGHFYVGAGSVAQSLRSFGAASFFYPDGPGLLAAASDWKPAAAVALAILAALPTLLGMLSFRRARPDQPVLRLGWLCSASASGTMVLALILHSVWGFPLPAERTGLYFLLLAPLAFAAQTRLLLEQAGLARRAGLALALIGIAAAGRFALSLETRSFYLWRYDADTKAIADQIEALGSVTREGTSSIGASWMHEPSLNYYILTRGWWWMAPVTRDSPRGEHGYYVLSGQDRTLVEDLKLEPIAEYPRSGVVLAAKRKPPPA